MDPAVMIQDPKVEEKVPDAAETDETVESGPPDVKVTYL